MMNIGDHLVTPRTGYTHHGLYIGNNEVIHYLGFADGLSNGEISITTIDKFCNGHEIYVQSHLTRTYDREESSHRAFQRLGEDWYNVLLNNCEHFVTWCIDGFHSSSQVNLLIANVATVAYSIAERNAQRKTVEAAAALWINQSLTQEVNHQVVQVAASSATKSILSSTAGTAAGIASGAGFASATGVTVGLATGLATASAAPVILTFAAMAGVGYGVKKLADWFWD